MGNSNFILEVRSSYNQLTKTEKKVADYVLKNQKKVLFMSITELADACHVGDTSVYRFCRTMGLQGYQEFKMKLSLCQVTEDSALKMTRDSKYPRDNMGEMAEQVMQLHMGAIKETYMLLDRDNFKKTLDMIEAAERVFFFGIGDSLLTAEEARNKFLRATGKVICITDPHMQAMAASTMTPQDLIVIVSYSGATKDNVQVAKEAKASGAKISCITHFQKSPLTVFADSVLLCGSSEGPLEGGSMGGKMSQLYLIDLLYQEYCERNYEVCAENTKKTSSAVVEKLF